MLTIILTTLLLLVYLTLNIHKYERKYTFSNKIPLYIFVILIGISFGTSIGSFIKPNKYYYKKISEQELVPFYYKNVVDKTLKKNGYKTNELYDIYMQDTYYSYSNNKKEFNRFDVNSSINRRAQYCVVTKESYDEWLIYQYFLTPSRNYHVYNENIIIMECPYDYNNPRYEEYQYYVYNQDNFWNTKILNWFSLPIITTDKIYSKTRYWYIPKNSIQNNFNILNK